jgi:hypothetical protein
MSQVRNLAALALLLLGLGTSAVNGAVINVDTVLGPANPYRGYPIEIVDGPNPPTRVTILPGFEHYAPRDDYYNGLILTGSSEVNMLGGQIVWWENPVELYDRSRFRMSGGETSIEAFDQSRVMIEGGILATVKADDQSRLRMNAPWNSQSPPTDITVDGNAHAELVDGYFGLFTRGGTTIIRGGIFETAEFHGGDSIIAGDALFMGIHLHYGTVHLMALKENYLGGEVPLGISRGGMLHVYGTDLRIDDGGPNVGWDVIRGYLADGDEFHGAFYGDRSQVVLHELPEPSAIVLAAAGLTALMSARHFTRTRQ